MTDVKTSPPFITQQGAYVVNIIGNVPLMTGAATAANQGLEITALTAMLAALTGGITIGGTVTVSNFPATQPISAATLPLPTGAAQDSSLSTINTTLDSPFQAGGSIGNSTFGISDPARNDSATAVINNTLASADILDIGIGTPDSAGFTAIVGDPNGDFAGVNLLETLMDDASGLGLGVRVLNQPKLGPDGALILSDGKQFNINQSATTVTIIDTLGYQTFNITNQSGTYGAIAFSNDLQNWNGASVFNLSGQVNNAGTNSNYIGPIVARYMRLSGGAAGSLVVYLRTFPYNPVAAFPYTVTSCNLQQVGGVTAALASGSGNAAGILAIGGYWQPGSPLTANTGPLLTGSLDPYGLVRRAYLDQNGSSAICGSRPPLQPDTKTTNPLPAYVPPLPVKVSHNDDSPGPDTPGLLDSLRLMTSLLASIDRRLQELPARIVNGLAANLQLGTNVPVGNNYTPQPVQNYLDTDDFPAYRDDPSLLTN